VPKKPQASDPKASPDEQRKERELGESGAAVESVAERKRRRFSAAEKRRILKAADAAVASGERGALEALLRREGIYSSHLSSWRQQRAAEGEAGLSPRKPGRKPKLDEAGRQLLALTKKNAALERKLRMAEAIIALQKKAHEILGIALPEHEEVS
jgi:transposase